MEEKKNQIKVKLTTLIVLVLVAIIIITGIVLVGLNKNIGVKNEDKNTTQIGDKQTDLNTNVTDKLNKARLSLSKIATRIDTLSPMKIIARGYTISEMNGKIIKSAKEVNVGDLVELKYIDGSVKASVTEKMKNE